MATSATTTNEVLSNDRAHSGVISIDPAESNIDIDNNNGIDIDNDNDTCGQEKMLTMQFLEQISDNSVDQFDDDDDDESADNETAKDAIQDTGYCSDEITEDTADSADATKDSVKELAVDKARVHDGCEDAAQDTGYCSDEITEDTADSTEATKDSDKELAVDKAHVHDDSEDADGAVISDSTDEENPDEATEDASILDDVIDESGVNGAEMINDDDDDNDDENETAESVDMAGETIGDMGDDAPAVEAQEDCITDDATSEDTDGVVADNVIVSCDGDCGKDGAKDGVIVDEAVAVAAAAAAEDGGEDAPFDGTIENRGDMVIDGIEANDTSNEDVAVEAEENEVADEVDEDSADEDSAEDVVVDESQMSLEEFVHAFVFTFDEDERGLSETDGRTFDDEETYSDEDVTYLSDENDELKLIRDSYSEYKRAGKFIDPEASCYTKKKKDDIVDEACAAIDRFYWRLTSLFIKTKKNVQESAKKGKAVAEENINSERWSKEINEAKKAKEALLKSFHQCTAMGYDINASDGNTVGIKESFSTASDDDDDNNNKPSKQVRAVNTKKLYEKDCKHFSNFAGMSSKEANDFFESVHPSVVDFHNQFIGPCMPLENVPKSSQSEKLSQWLNSAKSGSNKSKVIDSAQLLQGLENEKSGSTPGDESPESLEQAEESKCDIPEKEKIVFCESEERDTTTPKKSTLENNEGDGLDAGANESNKEKESGKPRMESSSRSSTVKAKKTKKQRFWIPGRSKKTEESKKREESRRLSSIILIKSDAIEAATPNEDFLKMIAANKKKAMRRKKRNGENSTAASSFVLSAGDTGCEVLM